ncbi:MAG: TRAM domain-containing protein [Planctomycetia bacterium]|nr:TRAM domain-containing protein [Planctomycetia bacterium]
MLRVVFVILCGLVGLLLATSGMIPDGRESLGWLVFFGVMALAAGIIFVDMAFPKKSVDAVSSVYFGLLVGLLLSYAVWLAVVPFFPTGVMATAVTESIRLSVQLLIAAIMCYLCISVLFQTRHDFRFIIPYVEFARELRGNRTYVLDTSVVIDGRIVDVIEANLMDGQMVMPQFALDELQAIADSADRGRRARGRRGLDILNQLRLSSKIDFRIFTDELPVFAGNPVDLKLVLLARHLEGRLVTNDYNLNKVAKVHGVVVINLNDLANAMKSAFLPGDTFEVRILRPGEAFGQGVGYIDDGTMVVVENGRDHIHEIVQVSVTSIRQTSAGRMIFARYEHPGDETAQSVDEKGTGSPKNRGGTGSGDAGSGKSDGRNAGHTPPRR